MRTLGWLRFFKPWTSVGLLAQAALAQESPIDQASLSGLGASREPQGIQISGYLDISYSYFPMGTGSYRLFDKKHDSLNLQVLDLAVSTLPAQGYGGLLHLKLGPEADVLAAAGTDNDDEFDVTEAYVRYIGGPVEVTLGKFYSLAGVEYSEAPKNYNFSHSYVISHVPGTLTGVRGAYTVNPTLKLIAGLSNGWDNLEDENSHKTLEAGIALTPQPNLSLSLQYYGGKEGEEPAMRHFVDAVASYSPAEPLTLALDYTQGRQENAALPNGDIGTAQWQGLAGYVNYQWRPQWRVALRGEVFRDRDGLRLSSGIAQTIREATFTLAYLPTDHLELRGELRVDESDQAVFAQRDGTLKRHQSSLAFEAIYKFW